MAAGLFSRPSRRIKHKEIFLPGWGFKLPRFAMENLPSAGFDSWGSTNQENPGARLMLEQNPNMRIVQIELVPATMNPSPGVYNLSVARTILNDIRAINSSQGRKCQLWLMHPTREFTANMNVSKIFPPFLKVPVSVYKDQAGDSHQV